VGATLWGLVIYLAQVLTAIAGKVRAI